MGLSCDCGWDDYEWYYEVEDAWRIALTDFKCYGCGEPRKAGEHVRILSQVHELEDEYGEEIIDTEVIGYKRICEPCMDQYDSLTELGFCLTADFRFIRDAMIDYRENYTVQRRDKHGVA